MAWAGIFLGMIAGLAAVVLSYLAAGLPLWASLLMYPATGTAVALLITVSAALRSLATGSGRKQVGAERSAATA